jgi:hypothetical protein
LTEEQRLLLRMLKNRTTSFIYIDQKVKDKRFCLEAVKINGLILKFIKNKEKDVEICNAAIENNRKAILYVPSRLRVKDEKMSGSYQDDYETYCYSNTGSVSRTPVTEEEMIANMGKVAFLNSFERYRDTDYFGVTNQFDKMIHLEERDDYLENPYWYNGN